MDSQLKKGLLEKCILAFLNHKSSYGYEIIHSISDVLPITESTLYPILKRLEKNDEVTTYTKEHNGRLRKYYAITEHGKHNLKTFYEEKKQIDAIYSYIGGSLSE